MRYLTSGPKRQLSRKSGRSADGIERQKLYISSEWRTLRRRHLKDQPYCVHCFGETGKLVRGFIVDHIRGHDHADWRETFFEPIELQTLCKRHHDVKTKKEKPRSGFSTEIKQRLSESERVRVRELLQRKGEV